MPNKIIELVNGYFAKKINDHGAMPEGVGWNSTESQEIRFKQLCKVVEQRGHFSILDYGCGYGALLNYLKRYESDFSYTGFDISDEMVKKAIEKYFENENAKWTTKLVEDDIYDYVVASGIFNIKLDIDKDEWTNHVMNTINIMNKKCTKGFSFNMLTSYSDKEYMKDDLYYADPLFFFDYCKKNFSKNVALLHDYQIYDFTIIVRK